MEEGHAAAGYCSRGETKTRGEGGFGVGVGCYETAGKAAGGASAFVKKCFEMEIPAGRSRRPARSCNGVSRSRPAAAEITTKRRGKRRGATQSIAPPLPTPSAPTQPKTSRHFPLVSAGNQTPPPSVHPWPEPVNFCKNHVLFYLFPA